MQGSELNSYTLNRKTRCMDARWGENEKCQYLVGTTEVHQPNQIQILEYDQSLNTITVPYCFEHPDQAFELACHPKYKNLLLTIGKANGKDKYATIWKLPDMDSLIPTDSNETSAQEYSEGTEKLLSVASIPAQRSPVTALCWNQFDTTTSMCVSAHGTTLHSWKLDATDQTTGGSITQDNHIVLDLSLSSKRVQISCVQWDPHSPHYITCAVGNAIQTWDVRSQDTSFSIPDAASGKIYSIDYNPNRPFSLASSGDDGKINFWDIRYPQTTLLSLAHAHSHWVTALKYNRLHDQLVLSGSSDRSVGLWRVSSISSAPLVDLEDPDFMSDDAITGTNVRDIKIKKIDDHEDTIVAVSWSTNDTWEFGSLSFDGKFHMHQVPSTEKYKILL